MDILRNISDLAARRERFALATVLETAGSTPRGAGTRAIVRADGGIIGTIGGGAAEAETQRRGREAIRTGAAIVFEFAMQAEHVAAVEPICGGRMRILIDPTAAEQAAIYAQAANALAMRERGVLVTEVRLSARPQVTVRWRASAGADRPTLIVREEQGTRVEAFVEPLSPPPLLLIAGGGHVGQALALQAQLVGFDVVVIDDRVEFTGASLYPVGVKTRCGDIADELARLPVAADTYVAIVTRGHQHDRAALAVCIGGPAAYIGMIGSRRKVAMIRRELLESGVATAEQFDRVRAPIGLDIGAETAEEIAASIVAELIAVRRGGKGRWTKVEGRGAREHEIDSV